MRAYYKENKKLQTYNIIIEIHFSNQSIRILLYSYTRDKVYIHIPTYTKLILRTCICIHVFFFFFCHDRNPVVIVQLGINWIGIARAINDADFLKDGRKGGWSGKVYTNTVRNGCSNPRESRDTRWGKFDRGKKREKKGICQPNNLDTYDGDADRSSGRPLYFRTPRGGAPYAKL